MAAVVLHANASDVEHVLVDGEFRKRDFKLVNLPLALTEIRERFLRTARKIQAQVGEAPPLPEKLWYTGEFGDVQISTTIRRT